jgi:putative ABC transport system permease protein
MNLGWYFKMAWRDSRKNRGRLLLFMSSIVLGIAALVAINSFGENLKDQVDREAKSLLSADLEIESRQPFSKEVRQFFDSLGVETTEEIGFGSMVLFKSNNGSRLVNVRAIGKGYPYYGAFTTKPEKASVYFHSGQDALVDKTLMIQFGAQIGDSVKIGELTFRIAGTVIKVPGQSGIVGSVAPPVFIPVRFIEETNLVQRGSRINYSLYLKYPAGFDPKLVAEVIKPRLDQLELEYEDVEKRKQQVGNAYADMTSFLNLTAFVALLLGCIGVAGSVHIYMKEKVNPVAILRCLGASANQAMNIFLVQIFIMGSLGSIFGAVLGTFIQYVMPSVFAEFLPFDVDVAISWKSILQGTATGITAAMLFALFPLLGIKGVSPLKAIRASFETSEKSKQPWIAYVLVVLFIIGFSWMQLDSWRRAVAFSAAVILSFGLLAAFARSVIWLVRKYFPYGSSFIIRQGLANLYRPNNQTLILVVTIGLGTILITSLVMSRQLLLDKLNISSEADTRPNMIIFDIQDSDLDSIKAVTASNGMPVIDNVPIVSMKLHALKDIGVSELRKDTADGLNNWVLDREYRVTYRDSLIDSEKIISGKWVGKVNGPADTVFVSISENFADDMQVRLGDAVSFNVQGAIIKTCVGSIRKVDFQRVQPNFLVLFPSGVLENAPKFHVLLTRFQSPEQSASYQQQLVMRFPNVAIIDLNLILQTVDDVVKKVSFIIQFMALFSIFTGILVLIGSVIISKYQRIRESVLLRTMGATRKQILGINLIEYLMLGSLASLTGIIISVGLNMLLARFTFNAILVPDLLPLLIAYLTITSTTVVIGLLNSREVVNKPPLEILRSEG